METDKQVRLCHHCKDLVPLDEGCACCIELAQKDKRIRELEGLLQQFVEQYPCEHEPERFFENPECDYCSLFIEANSQLEEV